MSLREKALEAPEEEEEGEEQAAEAERREGKSVEMKG